MRNTYRNEVVEVGFTTRVEDAHGDNHLVLVKGQADANGWKFRTIEDSLGETIYSDTSHVWMIDDKSWTRNSMEKIVEQLDELL